MSQEAFGVLGKRTDAMAFFSLSDALRWFSGGDAKEEPVFKTEKEAYDFCRQVYNETGGATTDLRRAYEFYLKNITISALSGSHHISAFSCGESQLDRFICKKARKYHQRNRVKVFCAHPRDGHTAYGIYTLTMKIEETNKLLQSERDLITDRHFPAIYIGTLAVLSRYQSNGLGTILLMNALQRSYYVSQNVAVFGVALRSLNERTTRLYQRYGFGLREQTTTPLMVLPIWSLNELIEGKPTRSSPQSSGTSA